MKYNKYCGSKIVKCPYCGKKKTLLSMLSGNNIGVIYWSDMMQVAPMWPKVSPVQECPQCGSYYLEYKQEADYRKGFSDELGELTYWEWKKAYNQFCNKSKEKVIGLDEEDWNNIRLWLIQVYNDQYNRDTIRTPCRPPQEEFDFIEGIINDYIESFDWSSVKNPLLKAELYRESYQFEKCEETLKNIDFSGLERFERLFYDDLMKFNQMCYVKAFMIREEHQRLPLPKFDSLI